MKALSRLFFLLVISASCLGQTTYGTPDVNPVTLQKNFQKWFDYQSVNIMMSVDFVGLDTQGKNIKKELFLQRLNTGLYIPIRLVPNKNTVYKLFKITPKADTSIKATIKQLAFDAYEHFKMEGKPFPKFDFTDLNGTVISNETMKGKYVIIKCWYIHCTACIEEFPAVNQLVEKYKGRDDMLFVSLAEDTPAQLTTFLAKKPLSYSVVPNMKNYMNLVLSLNGFPTHFILDKEGTIVKVLSDYQSLNTALETLLKDN